MYVHVDFAVVFQLFCIVQGLTTGAYMLAAKPRRAGNRWLGLLLLGLTLQVIDYFLSRSGVYYRNRWLYFTPLFFSWSFGPLLYAYVRAFYGQSRLRWTHFIPGAVQVLFYLVLTLQSFDTKTWFWLVVHKPYTRWLEYYGTIISVATYLGLSLRVVKQHGQQPQWLRNFMLGLGGFYALAALDPLVNSAYLPDGAPTFYLTSLVLPVFAYWLALLGWLKKGSLRSESLESASLAPLVVQTRPAVPAPSVDAQHLARIVHALEQEQLFKTPELTLDGPAQHVGLTPNAVSQTINAGLGKSFSELINDYRLQEVKQRLLTDDVRRLTVLAIAFEAGFNSKTTFNRIFKEKTGLTPKDYRKKYQVTHWDDSIPASS